MATIGLRVRRRFGKLRWRFAASYMLVTVLSVLTIPTLYFAASYLVAIRSPDLPRQMAADLRAVAPQTLPYLVQVPVDQAGLERWLTDFNSNGRAQGQGTFADLWMSGPPYGTSRMMVVDGSSRVIAASSPGGPPAGTPLTATLTPPQRRVVDAALAGDERASDLATPETNGRAVIAVPIIIPGRTNGALVLDMDVAATRASYLPRAIESLLGIVLALTIGTGLIGLLFGFLISRGLTRRLARITRAADAWSRGDFSVAARDPSGDELGQLARDLNRMAEQVRSLLEDRQQLAVMEERNRLSRELHDAVKQQIFATGMQVAAAEALAERDPAAAKRHVTEAARLIEQSKQELNTLIHALRPAALGDRGLVPALRDLAADWARGSGMAVEVRALGERPAPLQVEQALFRVAQEALSNAARHSGATAVDVRAAWETQAITLTISDNGHGFDPPAHGGQRAGVGLGSMTERMEALGGTLLISSSAAGTRIEARIPLPSRAGLGATPPVGGVSAPATAPAPDTTPAPGAGEKEAAR